MKQTGKVTELWPDSQCSGKSPESWPGLPQDQVYNKLAAFHASHFEPFSVRLPPEATPEAPELDNGNFCKALFLSVCGLINFLTPIR